MIVFFFLSGVYGDVQRVKILFNKKDNALIQYAEPQQAQLGIYIEIFDSFNDENKLSNFFCAEKIWK